MKRALCLLAAAILATGPCSGSEPSRERELSLSLGSGIGDFGSTLTGGLSLNLPLGDSLRLEPELFYYYDPGEPSHTEGLAVTSTALSAGLGLLYRRTLVPGRIVLDLGMHLGVLHVSESREVDALKQIESLASSEACVGPAVVFRFRLGGRAGVRFDAHWLFVPWDGRSIPRLSVGYDLRY